MIISPDDLIDEFVSALRETLSRSVSKSVILHQLFRAPHAPPDLPPGKCGVYVFSLSSTAAAWAGANRVLKVGKVGVNSGPRFKYQHYQAGSAKSTVAGALANNRILWKYLGVPTATADIGEWLKRYTDRDHFLVDGSNDWLVPHMEVFFKAVLGPALEGSLAANRHEAG